MRYLPAFQSQSVTWRIGAVIAVAALILVTVVLLSSLGGGGDGSGTSATPEGTTTVASPDGRAVLEIPDGALPEGITAADISIRHISLDGLNPDEVGALAAGYEFLPNGLELQVPAVLNLRLELEALPEVLFVAHVSDDAWELLTIADSEFDPETGTVAITTSLSHFSFAYVYLSQPGGPVFSELIGLNPLTVDATASASKVAVGASFDFTATLTSSATPGLTWSQAPSVINQQAGMFEVTVTDPPLTFKARVEADSGYIGIASPVTPTRVDDPPNWALLVGSTYEVTQTFECVKDGTAILSYWVHARVPVKGRRELMVEGELRDYLTTGHIATSELGVASVKCTMPKIVASAAPPFTTYTLSPEVSTATHFAWSGADCGSVTGSTTSTMVWNHGEEGCEHAGEAHPNSEITVLVTGKFPESGTAFEMRCNYRSAASGEGAKCVLKP